MAYTKTTWVDNSAPAIDAENLNKIEQGIYDAHTGKQDRLVSGTNIKTINGNSILGSGNLVIEGGGGGGGGSETDPIFTASPAYDIAYADITSWNGKASVTSLAVTIAVADWNATTTCTKSVTGVTASNNVLVCPDPASIDNWGTCGVYCSAQGSGTLTFVCSSTPSASITVNVLVIN